MTTYLINHLRIPNGVPTPEGLVYLESVEAAFKPYGGNVISDLVLVDSVSPYFTSAEWARQIRTDIAAGSDGDS